MDDKKYRQEEEVAAEKGMRLAWKVYWSFGEQVNYLCVLAESEGEAREKLIDDMKDTEKWPLGTEDHKVLNAELLGEFIN